MGKKMTSFNQESLNQTHETSNKKNEAHLSTNRINNRIQRTNINKISDLIGKGDDAKNSIVWIIIRWSLIIPSGITVLYFITMWIVYLYNLDFAVQVSQIREHILKVWAVFSPLITLALGYIYGKTNSNAAEKADI